jgi:membrane protein implicated in regulation of membrane protease activity
MGIKVTMQSERAARIPHKLRIVPIILLVAFAVAAAVSYYLLSNPILKNVFAVFFAAISVILGWYFYSRQQGPD